MNLDQDFFQVTKFIEDQKKKVFIRNGTLFSPNSGENQKKTSSPEMEPFFSLNSSTDLRSDAHQSQIIGGDAGEDHTQIVGGIYPPIPPGFPHPWLKCRADSFFYDFNKMSWITASEA